MQKSAIAAAVALIGAFVAAPVANAAPPSGDTHRACADIVEGRVNYQSLPDDVTPTGAEVLAQMDLGAAACKNVIYTMSVYAGETNESLLATASGVAVAATDQSPPRVEFQTPVPFASLSDVVCVVIASSIKSNGRVLDRAPDSECVALPINSTVSGAQRFR